MGKINSPSVADAWKGWDIKEFLKGYFDIIKPTLLETIKKTGKEIGKFLVTALIGYITTQNPAYTGIVTLLGKGLLDIIEYGIKRK